MQAGTLVAHRYRIEEKLGEGGMGVVFRAHDTLLNRAVAIKALLPVPGEDGGRRLLREAQAAAQLSHPGIVGIHDVVAQDAAPLVVMELVDGRPLSDLIPLDVLRTVELAQQVARALQYAHARGVVHRDIKPENILVTDDGTAKVMDFGLARSEGRSRLTQPGLIVGTVAYMAPEQILGGTVDGRADLYSLGCVLYEAVTGRKPFEGEDAFTVLSQHVNVMPVAPRWHNPAVSVTLDAIVMRLLAKNPDDRYAAAEALLTALASAAEPGVVEAAGEATSRAALLERIVRGKLVGRAAEMREQREHLDRALGGEGRLVFISGEPGIGKTRLAEELAVYAHLRGAMVLRGHCYEQDVAVPYLPFLESLRQLQQGEGRVTLADLGDRSADLARLVPELKGSAGPPPALSPDDERARTFEAVTQWAAATARRRPIVFILDDLHWADRASLRLLHHLARTLRSERVLFLATYRDVELDLQHPLNDALAQMNRERLYYRILLRRLSEEDTHALLSGLFDASVSAELARAVYRETEGNPFFIEEVVKALVEEGRIYREGGRWQRLEIHQLEIPQSVRAVIGRRLQQASEACQRALTIGAVLGREFDPDVLMKVGGLDEDVVLDALDEALRLQLIREARSGRTTLYAFEHALIQQTLYEGLNARRRMRLHEQAGGALEELHQARLDDHVEELAYHFGEAGPALADKGIAYNMRAAEKAAIVYAVDDAERRLQVAMELAEAAEDPRAVVRVLEALGDLYALFQDRRAVATYRRAIDLAERHGFLGRTETVRLYTKFAETGIGWWEEAPPDTITFAERTVEMVRDGPDAPEKARAFSVLAMHLTRRGNVEAARPYADEALAIATRLRLPVELSQAYRALAMVHRYSNDWAAFRDLVQRRAALVGDALEASDFDLYGDIVFSYTAAGRLVEAEAAARDFLALAEKLRSPTAAFRALAHLATALFLSEKWDEAIEAAERAIALNRGLNLQGWYVTRPVHRLAEIYAARGQWDLARSQLAELEAIPERLPPEHTGAAQFAFMVALQHRDMERVRQLLPRIEQERPRCRSCAFTHGLVLAEAYIRLNRLDDARARLAAADRELPGARGAYPTDLGDIANVQALFAEAEGNLNAAVELMEQSLQARSEHAHFYAAATMEELARLRLRRGAVDDTPRAQQLLEEALATYARLGAHAFEVRVHALLATAGEVRA